MEGKYDKLIRGDLYNDADEDEDGKLWNYVILDEGHIIKNPSTQRAKSLLEIPCVQRIVISGTPIQNNLKEMWALFYFCCPEVLGDKDEFKSKYESAIIRGNDKNATDREKITGSTVAKVLRERIKPYFLRRTKSEVFVDTGLADDKKLSKKNELIVWLRLTPCQRKLLEEGHHVLIFSQTRKMLNLIQIDLRCIERITVSRNKQLEKSNLYQK